MPQNIDENQQSYYDLINFFNMNKLIYYFFFYFTVIFIIYTIRKRNEYKPLLFNLKYVGMWASVLCMLIVGWIEPAIFIFENVEWQSDKITTDIIFYFTWCTWCAIYWQLGYEYYKKTTSLLDKLRFYSYQIFIYKNVFYVSYFNKLFFLLLIILLIFGVNVWSIILCWYITLYFYECDNQTIDYTVPEKDTNKILDIFITMFFYLFILIIFFYFKSTLNLLNN